MLDRLSSLPNIPDLYLTSYEDIMEHFIKPLEIVSPQKRGCVESTLQSHFRKAKNIPDTNLKKELAVIIARSAPLFLLEAKTYSPRTELFRKKRGKIVQYLHLPQKNDYFSLLASTESHL